MKSPYDDAITKAIAVIQSEIADGDREMITLEGKRYGNEFEIKKVLANWFEIEF